MTLVAARNLPGLLEISVLRQLPVERRRALRRHDDRPATSSSLVGTVLAFGAIGIGWSKVQWLVAAVAVGLGFGLQEIFANFVSGLIILFERPIRVGDIVTVGDVNGTVTQHPHPRHHDHQTGTARS